MGGGGMLTGLTGLDNLSSFLFLTSYIACSLIFFIIFFKKAICLIQASIEGTRLGESDTAYEYTVTKIVFSSSSSGPLNLVR